MLLRIQPTTGVTIFYRDLNDILFATTNKDFESLESMIRIAKIMFESKRFYLVKVMVGRYSSQAKRILTEIHYEKGFD